MDKKKRWISIFILALGVVLGCSSLPTDQTVDYSLNSIFSATESAMTMGIHKYSENHREFFSRPFMVSQNDEAKKHKLHERGLAKVVILGDRRPYNIEVSVSIERASNTGRTINESDYSFDRYDKRLANKLLNNIIAILNKRQREKNIIDDFRPF